MKYLIISLLCFLFSIIGFTQTVNRIVSLAPSLTMNVYYLESKQKLVGCTSYCEIAKPDKKEIIGSIVTVNIEKIVSLKPDLVIATSITKPAVIDKLRKMGIRVEVFSSPKNFEAICEEFLHLGTLIGKTEKAKAVIAESKAKVEKIKASHKTAKKSKVFFQIGADPIFSVLSNTFMNDYILYCGGVNIAADLKSGSIGRESVLQRNPDVIFIITMGITGDEEKKIWLNYPELTATKKKQIFIIDSNLACTPTPVSFVQTLEIVNKLLSSQK